MTFRTAPADYYTVLGIAPTATPAEIRRAYRDLARRLHPDVNPAPDAAERFAAVARAYDILSDPARRRAYDLSRSMPPRPHAGRSAAAAGAGMPTEVGPDGQLRPRRGTAPPLEPSLRGLDLFQIVRLSLREAAFGTNKTITVPRREVCLTCHGTGAAAGAGVRQCPRCHGTGRGHQRDEECALCQGNGAIPTVPCPTCGGAGRVESAPEFPLHFPSAIEDGEVLRIKNEGNPGPQGGPRGDLRLLIQVESDPVLRRNGAEVYADITITPDQAARGGRIAIPTLHGSGHIRLPKGTPDGAHYLMRGQGLRLKGHWRRGDQHVTVHVAEQPTFL